MIKQITFIALFLLIGTLCISQDQWLYPDGSSWNECETTLPTYYAASATYIYQSADVSSAIVTKVPKGDMVKVIYSGRIPNPEMWEICHKGKSGYALKKKLSYENVAADPAQESVPDGPIRKVASDTGQPISERIKYENAKKQYGGLFGNGKTENAGNQGDPNGNPESDVSSGISTGAGTIGGGLENRGGAGPAIEDRSEEQGKVVIRICVNSSGKVISSDFTQRGSTTSSQTLIALAKKNAMQYTFNSGSPDKQCGTIAYNFRVM